MVLGRGPRAATERRVAIETALLLLESSQRCALARFSLQCAALVRGGLFVFCVHMCLFVCERIILLFPQVLSHLSENSLET